MKKTKWRQRLRGTFKWGGVMLCMLLFALWLASGWWGYSLTRLTGTDSPSTPGYYRDQAWEIGISSGRITVQRTPAVEYGANPEWFWSWSWNEPRSTIHAPSSGAPHWLWRFDHATFQMRVNGPQFYWIPLWLPFLLIALPTGFLFWSDHRRRMRAGCCGKCGYDLTGNSSGTCPECGGPADGSVTPARAAT